MRGFFCVSRRRATSRAVVCPGLFAGFKGAAALLPVGVDIRLDIHFVCPPPIRPICLYAYMPIWFYDFLFSVWEHDFYEIFSVLFVVFCVIVLIEK